MNIWVYLLSGFILSVTPAATISADPHGGVHIRIPSCEDANEDGCQEHIPPVCMELKPWYHHQHYDQYEDIEEMADELHDETTWPGQREDFSDYLMR